MLHPSLPKLVGFCAYQDRSRKEILEKMQELDILESRQEELLAYLEREKFWDEQRFVRQFVGGKFRQLQWGRRKIRFEIQKHQIPAPMVDIALREEISEEAYRTTLQHLIVKKRQEYAKFSPSQIHAKLARFLLSKGFEWEAFGDLLGE